MQHKTSQAFTELMDIANARRGYHVSDKLIERLFTPDVLAKIGSGRRLSELISDMVIVLPVGAAAQDAAISALGALGKKHSFLRPIALRALQSLASFKGEIAQQVLEDLQRSG